jgi:restriction endonuclease Mrr
MSNNTFHYPPELFNILVDTIPLLNRSKKDVLLFFKGAGVSDIILGKLNNQLALDKDSLNKYEISRQILDSINSEGDSYLRVRREIIRRVVQFESFDACWPNDQLKAKGLVASIREIVNEKDAFSRMAKERENERLRNIDKKNAELKAAELKASRIDEAKKHFYSLFSESLSPQVRGKKLETALNNLFKAYGILIREAFHLVGEDGEGIIEQVDGVIELKGTLYFVEMKWYKDPVGVPEISQHLVRLMSRAEGRGIFISYSNFTAPAIAQTREFLSQKILILTTLQEIVIILEEQSDLENFFIQKADAALIHKNPYYKSSAEAAV